MISTIKNAGRLIPILPAKTKTGTRPPGMNLATKHEKIPQRLSLLSIVALRSSFNSPLFF